MPKQTYPKLPADFKEKWVAALRSGEYKRGTSHLKSENNKVVKHCCLGVACEIVGAKNIYNKCYIKNGIGIKGITKLPSILIGNGGNDVVHKLTIMNDSNRYSFKQIANWIEKNL